MLPKFFESVLNLIVRTSTDLPPDVRAAMKTSLVSEPAGTRSSQALTIIAQNIDLAVDHEGAICQDTGMPTFEVHTPVGANQIWMRQQIREAVQEATKRSEEHTSELQSHSDLVCRLLLEKKKKKNKVHKTRKTNITQLQNTKSHRDM